MSKQRRPSQSQSTRESAASSGEGTEVREQHLVGNEQLKEQVTSPPVQFTEHGHSDAELVTQGLAALHLTAPENGERAVELLASSHLPTGQRETLIDKIETTQEAAIAVSTAVETWFGIDGESRRDELIEAFQSIDELLASHLGLEQACQSPGVDLSADAVRGFSSEVFLAVQWDEEEEEFGAVEYGVEEREA